MKLRWRVVLLLAIAAATTLAACRSFPTRSTMRPPMISGVVVFPETIGQGESTLVTVFASDPDGDALVYDWETFGELRIQGAGTGSGSTRLYGTSSPSRVFYRTTLAVTSDTTYIWCYASDRLGGFDSRRVRVLLRN